MPIKTIQKDNIQSNYNNNSNIKRMLRIRIPQKLAKRKADFYFFHMFDNDKTKILYTITV